MPPSRIWPCAAGLASSNASKAQRQRKKCNARGIKMNGHLTCFRTTVNPRYAQRETSNFPGCFIAWWAVIVCCHRPQTRIPSEKLLRDAPGKKENFLENL